MWQPGQEHFQRRLLMCFASNLCIVIGQDFFSLHTVLIFTMSPLEVHNNTQIKQAISTLVPTWIQSKEPACVLQLVHMLDCFITNIFLNVKRIHVSYHLP